MKVYEVGGAVRDALLGLPVTDRDWVVVGSSPQEMEQLGYRQVGRDFPVFLHPETHEEYALARSERKVSPGHTGFEVDASKTVTLEQDLARRDLTINAMARDDNGTLIDPHGGQADLESRILRHVSPAFREDPLRVLRTARFAAGLAEHDFEIAESTLELMGGIVASNELEALPAERVWLETEKALAGPRPDIFFSVLRACGALARLFPEVDSLFGVPQPKRWHPEIDTGLHTLLALKQARRLSESSAVAFAVLVHDLGKGTTPKALLPRHRGHEQRSVELLKSMCQRLRVPRSFESLAIDVARHHGTVHRFHELKPSTIHDLLRDIGALRNSDRIDDFIAACEADARGRTGFETRDYPQGDQLRAALAAALSITGDALADSGLQGDAFGAALRERRIAAIRQTAAELAQH